MKPKKDTDKKETKEKGKEKKKHKVHILLDALELCAKGRWEAGTLGSGFTQTALEAQRALKEWKRKS